MPFTSSGLWPEKEIPFAPSQTTLRECSLFRLCSEETEVQGKNQSWTNEPTVCVTSAKSYPAGPSEKFRARVDDPNACEVFRYREE